MSELTEKFGVCSSPPLRAAARVPTDRPTDRPPVGLTHHPSTVTQVTREPRDAWMDERDRLQGYLRELILDEAPTWTVDFNSGPGSVCSVSDAASVVASWIFRPESRRRRPVDPAAASGPVNRPERCCMACEFDDCGECETYGLSPDAACCCGALMGEPVVLGEGEWL